MNNMSREEINFCRDIYYNIDLLIKNNFEDIIVATFIGSIKDSMQYIEVRQYVLNQIAAKIEELQYDDSNVLKSLINVLVDVDNKEILELLESSLIKSYNLDNFLFLLEKEVALNKDTRNCEAIFITLAMFRNFDFQVFNKFANILKRDHKYISALFLRYNTLNIIINYLHEVGKNNIIIFEDIINFIFANYKPNIRSMYVQIIELITIYSPKLLTKFLYCESYTKSIFENYIIKSNLISPSILNYCTFLKNKDEQLFFEFEKEFIKSSTNLIQYASIVSFCNKKDILIQLVKLKNQDDIIEFIKIFPEYSKLIPML